MRPFKLLAFLTLIFTLILSCEDKSSQPGNLYEPNDELLKLVDPFIGTADHGHTYPGATVPFGMVQLSPDNGTMGWDWCSGYNYVDSTIVGFSHTHLSGTGIGDLYDISIMPVLGKIDLNKEYKDHKEKDFLTGFKHSNEKASPGYYGVVMDNKIKVELTTSERVGFHRYTFPENDNAGIVLDLSFAMNWDSPTKTGILKTEEDLITGYRFSTGWAKDQRVYFAIKISKPYSSFEQGIRNVLRFDTSEGEQIMLKVGLSSASEDGAIKALDEIPHWDFEKNVKDAEAQWKEQLTKVSIESDDQSNKTIFYTALYHTMLAPVLFSDANGEYKGADSLIHKAEGYEKYGVLSLWDTFRAHAPLMTIMHPDKVSDFINSFLSHYDEYGLLPVWELLGNETNTMTGYHAVPIIADAILKGFDGFDIEKAYEAMKKSSMQNIRSTDIYREYGYIPYDKAGQSVTKTLEYAFDDYCIATVADYLGKTKDSETYMERSNYYKNLYNEETGFMRARLSDKSWKTPFDPKYSDHNFDIAEYTEGNAWQHSWFVPHDINELVRLHGGEEPFTEMLDQLFTESSEIKGDNSSVDISGLIGQYAHGNEPSHHIAYMYNFAGKAYKTQEKVNNILTSLYTDKPNGLPGNEDCGQMSAWYVFSSMGFYPVNPVSGMYIIGSPLFDKIKLNIGDKAFEVISNNLNSENIYIQSAKLHGSDLDKSYIFHQDILNGGTLELEMGPSPSDWGKKILLKGMYFRKNNPKL